MPIHPITLPIYEELLKLPIVTAWQDKVDKTIREKRPAQVPDTYLELILRTSVFDRF